MKTYTNLYQKLKLRADNTIQLSNAITRGDVVTAIELLDAGDVDVNGGFLYNIESHVNEYDVYPCDVNDDEYVPSIRMVYWRLQDQLRRRHFWGIWPLEAAMRAKNLCMVSALLECGADITNVILRLAGEWGSIHAIALTLSYGANPTRQVWFSDHELASHEASYCAETMLSSAAREGHTHAVAFLMDCGVPFSQAAMTAALRLAVKSNHPPTVAALLDRGVPLDLPYPLEYGYRAELPDAQMTAVLIDRDPIVAMTHATDLLFAANIRGDVATAALLLQCGADLHTVECSGFEGWHPDLVHLYLTWGADATATAYGCNKPVFIRRLYEHGDASIALLISSGAPIVDIKM